MKSVKENEELEGESLKALFYLQIYFNLMQLITNYGKVNLHFFLE